MKTKLIPFDYEKYKDGGKVVRRDGKEPPIAIIQCPKATPPNEIRVVYANGSSLAHYASGIWGNGQSEPCDLFLEVPDEPRYWDSVEDVKWGALYRSIGDPRVVSRCTDIYRQYDGGIKLMIQKCWWLPKDIEHSTDLGKTWKPCVKD